MDQQKDRCTAGRKRNAAGFALGLIIAGNSIATLPGRSATTGQAVKENAVTTTQSKFYCNIKALTPEERAHHKQLGAKLMALRTETVELGKGYEFQYSPQSVTVAELADWVTMESKCCPFFDFHIDLENEGKLICLRLTGEEGVKQFIRAEFGID